ncbi:MAG: cinnamycin family lantibiotic [Actinobacteria bacterium]|nr:cinnamycin family lantibiotic [Actinomycetota bacterium]
MQSVVDEEFRALLVADPGLFNLSEPPFGLPTPVEPQDRTLLDLASGEQFSAMCITSCSSGFTFVCDGTTK